MSEPLRKPRPPSVSKASSRSAILAAARRVAVRDGAPGLSLRAVAAEAGFIVSGDKKHLLALRQFQGIPIVSPAEFLRRLRP